MKMFKRFFVGLVFVVILVYGAWCDELQDEYDIALAFVNQQIVKLVDNKATNVDYIFPFEDNHLSINKNLWKANKNQKCVLVARLINAKNSSLKEVKFLQKYKNNENKIIWCFPVEDLLNTWKFDNNGATARRWIEFLGLNPKYYKDTEAVQILFFLVKTEDLARPAYNPNVYEIITKSDVDEISITKNIRHPISSVYVEWNTESRKTFFMLAEYIRKQNPGSLCTRLGYTFDYYRAETTLKNISDIGNYFGVTELIVANTNADMYFVKALSVSDATKTEILKVVNDVKNLSSGTVE